VNSSELYALTEVWQISTAIFEALVDDQIGRNIYCITDVKSNLKLKKKTLILRVEHNSYIRTGTWKE
jgi:hypothetical protein